MSRIACLLFSQLAHVDIRRVRLHGVRLPLGRLVQHGRALPLDRADADRHACHHGALRASTSSLQNVACRVPNAMMVWEERRSMRPTPSSQQCFVSQLACLLCSALVSCAASPLPHSPLAPLARARLDRAIACSCKAAGYWMRCHEALQCAHRWTQALNLALRRRYKKPRNWWERWRQWAVATNRMAYWRTR